MQDAQLLTLLLRIVTLLLQHTAPDAGGSSNTQLAVMQEGLRVGGDKCWQYSAVQVPPAGACTTSAV